MAIDDVVVLNNIFTGIKVETFDAFLGSFEGFGDGAVLNGHILADTEALHKIGNALALENTH